MTSITEAKKLLSQFDTLKEEMETALKPIVDSWLELQVTLGNLTAREAAEEFSYVEQDSTHMVYNSLPWQETWNYGGYEDHSGDEIRIPFAFIEDQEPFFKDAGKEALKKLEEKKKQDKKAKQQAVRRLEAQLKKLIEESV